MLSINIPVVLEKQFWEIVRDDYSGDAQVAFATFLTLYEKYGWKEQLLKDVASIRAEVRRKSSINQKTINATIKTHRTNLGVPGA